MCHSRESGNLKESFLCNTMYIFLPVKEMELFTLELPMILKEEFMNTRMDLLMDLQKNILLRTLFTMNRQMIYMKQYFERKDLKNGIDVGKLS